MSIYAIGDLQGCLNSLQRLLDKIKFDPTTDQLWFTGDLVNRGPNSLETLRFVKSLGESAITVLGNHDFHLLAMAAGNMKYLKKSDSLNPILAANDRDELMNWLLKQKLIHTDKNLKISLVHAGVHPNWTIKQANKQARKVENVLQGKGYQKFLKNMYGNRLRLWHKINREQDKLRFILNTFTRMRYLHPSGKLDFKYSCDVGLQPKTLIPWFSHPERKVKKHKVIFGHWSQLSIHQTDNVFAVDTGCLWGERLTALEISKKGYRWHSIACNKKRL